MEKTNKNNPKAMLDELKSDLIKDEVIDEKAIEREKHRKEDHYHGNHHFDKSGNHDDISEDEFKITAFLKTHSKKNLIYKLVLTSVFLALAIAASAIDMFTESFGFPIGQVYIQIRILDAIVLLLALPAIGPIFASLLALLEPILHNIIHGFEHGWIQPITDSIGNVIIVLSAWLIYYFLFKNSPYHRDPNKKKDWIKRIVPASILVVVFSIVATVMLIVALKIQTYTSGNLLPSSEEMEKINFTSFSSDAAKYTFAIFGVNLLRYTIAVSLFVVIEGRMRVINHRYK